MNSGYRNPKEDFSIDSEVEQFNFNTNHKHLEFVIGWLNPSSMAAIERVEIYLKDGRLLKNIFIVEKYLAYYYEKDWYYKGDIRSKVPIPEMNLMKRFDFNKQDVLLIRSDNFPKPAIIDIRYFFSIFKPNRLDTKKSIEKNIFVKIKAWNKLPADNRTILYRI